MKTEVEKMMELYPDTRLVPFAEAREFIGKEPRCCAACPACYNDEVGIDCSAVDCGSGKVFVSPTLYIVARVNKWSSE